MKANHAILILLLVTGIKTNAQQVFSTNDLNFKKGVEAYNTKNWTRASDYFRRYLINENSSSIHESREKKLMNAYLYSAYCSDMANRLDLVIEDYEKGIKWARKLNDEPTLSLMLNNVGRQYQRTGRFEKALNAHNESLQLDIKLENIRSIGIDYSNLADTYFKWGDYTQALEFYEKSAKFHRENKDHLKAAYRDESIGEVYLEWNQVDNAIEKLTWANSLIIISGGNPASSHISLGRAYAMKKDYVKAEEHFKKGLEYDQRVNNEQILPEHLNALGLMYYEQKRYEDAMQSYKEAVALARFHKNKALTATILGNIGAVHFDQKQYSEAIPVLQESVNIKDELRKSAFGTVRREYLSSQINTYKFLSSSYMYRGEIAQAFHAIEDSRSKYLAEEIAKGKHEPAVLTIEETQELLGKDDVVLVYANADWRDKILIAITRESVKGYTLNDANFIRSVINISKSNQQTSNESQRGNLKYVAKKLQQKEALGAQTESDIFEVSINYYRNFLIKRAPEEALSRIFYQLLLEPVANTLKTKKNIIISPDGLLNYLPFETLKDAKGKYLIEKNNIRYTQSIGVLELLRKRNYSNTREYMLAFGGAVYNEKSYRADMGITTSGFLPGEDETWPMPMRPMTFYASNTPQDLIKTETLRSQLDKKSESSIRFTYDDLGIGTMNNLPGTLYEIEHIAPVVPSIRSFTKFEATEHNVKRLNKLGQLSNYKVLHFATHGLTIPVLPELSAVVLSMFKAPRHGEDGFLRTEEINELDIKADFVNLSACETGLGKIYGGEGVVGLTQSFLIAGANGLSVSLWSVADNSTAIFMVEVYKKVNQKNMDYYEAIAETKREFISGKFSSGFKAPYFWAPFVYYGR